VTPSDAPAAFPLPPTAAAVLSWLRMLASWIANIMFALVFLIFNYKIITRYIGHEEAVWADEVSVILFIWIIFWVSAFLVREQEQINFDLLYRWFGDRGKRVVAIIRHLLVGGLVIWSLPGSIDYILFLWRERTPVLDLRLDYVYACFGIFLIAVAIRSVTSLFILCTPYWRSRI
jgi:TRAP-type C4-dicarboxylate transport system permease small subunit